MSKIYGISCSVQSLLSPPPRIDLNFRHLPSCDTIDMIEMHRNSCCCVTKTLFFLEYQEVKLNDYFCLTLPITSTIFKDKLQKAVSSHLSVVRCWKMIFCSEKSHRMVILGNLILLKILNSRISCSARLFMPYNTLSKFSIPWIFLATFTWLIFLNSCCSIKICHELCMKVKCQTQCLHQTLMYLTYNFLNAKSTYQNLNLCSWRVIRVTSFFSTVLPRENCNAFNISGALGNLSSSMMVLKIHEAMALGFLIFYPLHGDL